MGGGKRRKDRREEERIREEKRGQRGRKEGERKVEEKREDGKRGRRGKSEMEGRGKGRKTGRGKEGRSSFCMLVACPCAVKLVSNTPHCPFLLLLPGRPAKAFTQALTDAPVPWLCHLLSGGTFS